MFFLRQKITVSVVFFYTLTYLSQWIFDNMALYFECRINIKRTPSDCFLAILPTGISQTRFFYKAIRLSLYICILLRPILL